MILPLYSMIYKIGGLQHNSPGKKVFRGP